ncbi:hypothetical protein [Pseudomonas sp. BN415]|nr:hypothetical protein [Pseudomonas sp. BN415]
MKALITFTAILAFSSTSFADTGSSEQKSSGNGNGSGAQYPEWLINHDG